MSLKLALYDNCAGHLCDECRVCKGGQCCRRDHPRYELPTEEDWPWPIWGQRGVLDIRDRDIECHACGDVFRVLAGHIWQKHNLTSREYKAVFLLPLGRALVALDVTKVLREQAYAEQIWQRAPEHFRPTPEQQSFALKGRRQRWPHANAGSFQESTALRLDGRRSEIEERLKNGESVRSLIRTCGVSKQAIYRWFRTRGVRVGIDAD